MNEQSLPAFKSTQLNSLAGRRQAISSCSRTFAPNECLEFAAALSRPGD